MNKRRLPLIFMDSVIVLFSVYVSHFILLSETFLLTDSMIINLMSVLLTYHVCAYVFKLYKRAWEYASMTELTAIVYTVTIAVTCTGIVQFILWQQIHVQVLFIVWMMLTIWICGSRMLGHLYQDKNKARKKSGKRTLIVGAGSAGTMVARQLQQNKEAAIYPIGYLDDNFTKHGLNIVGLPVLGDIKKVKQVVREYSIDCIIIAIPSLSKTELHQIVARCAETKVRTQILPSLEDLVLGNVQVSQFKDVEVEDLLGREPVDLDSAGIAEYMTGKVVLVTGAGGSIGSEVCRQVARFSPEKLILLGHGENSIHMIETELRRNMPELRIETEIADIKDREKIVTTMETHKPYVIFHAAAHKHVPLMERHLEEAVKNNVIGTKNVAEAASLASVNTFVMISTDKAVNPTSVMGATKRLAEMVIQSMDLSSNTRFVAVRFGNVLGSRGSVIPLFKEQIKAGGPVTITHPQMSRYFMTIPEASRLVLQAGALAQGGEIFVLDMGEPIKIIDLARNLIRLSGYTEDEIKITFTGMRPGEKLIEELLGEDEVHHEQVYPKIYRGKRKAIDRVDIDVFIDRFEKGEIQKDDLLALANLANHS